MKRQKRSFFVDIGTAASWIIGISAGQGADPWIFAAKVFGLFF